jgi:site-specific DNA recombinase
MSSRSWRSTFGLSGLIKCGCCGSSYTVAGRDKRGTYLRCSRFTESGTCDNRRTVGMTTIEQKALHAIEHRLAAPDLITEYVREYHRLSRAAAGDKAKARARLERDLVNVKLECNRVVDAILKEAGTRTLSERLVALEAKRADLEAALEKVAAPPVEMHPRAGDVYRRQVADLKGLLAAKGEDWRERTRTILRGLIDRRSAGRPLCSGRIRRLWPIGGAFGRGPRPGPWGRVEGGDGCGGSQRPLPNTRTVSTPAIVTLRQRM